MNNLKNTNNVEQIFNFMGTSIRVVMIDGEPWFVAKDVCDILEIGNPTMALRRLNPNEKNTLNLIEGNKKGNPKKNVVNEPGLYSLISRSDKPEAKAFQHWVNHEVLPSIRKTGGYVANDDLFIETYFPFADDQTKSLFRDTLETIRKQNNEIAMMQPKAIFYDALVDRGLLTNFRDTAKELKIGQKEFINWLIDNGYVYRDGRGKLKPYKQHVPKLFEIKEPSMDDWQGVQTLITPIGKKVFFEKLTNTDTGSTKTK
ncbi:BRO family protein [Desulfosporosinus sp. FKB]|uniref:BRO family protein n=1 Tax=Desulfosporosinus sp. FKB TaxID=1969835 RepID=UPI000B49EBC2|nr:BRO family protein [Desulfosporosinus sp. FKB]